MGEWGPILAGAGALFVLVLGIMLFFAIRDRHGLWGPKPSNWRENAGGLAGLAVMCFFASLLFFTVVPAIPSTIASLGLIVWHLLVLGVALAPTIWLANLWMREAASADQAARIAGLPPPRLAPSLKWLRAGLVAVALVIGIALSVPLYRATPSLTIGLGLGHMLQAN